MQDFLATFSGHVVSVLMNPFDPNQRIFLLYVLTSLLAAFLIWRAHRHANRSEGKSSFLGFLFPKSVWDHPSAWLDVRYFFFHKFLGHFFLLGLLGASGAGMFRLVTGEAITGLTATQQGPLSWGIVVIYMVVSAIVVDFMGYAVHYLQHKVPILWEFHKVHHSAEVMHPLSNYREHPVDNLLYMLLIGGGYGAVTGVAYLMLDVVPALPSVLGVPILMFLFNIAAYNLRHSHVWLRWPGAWSKIFPSPAHHHVHHSCHPDHFDKNFAFMFPLWDVVFGTYIMPEDNRDVKFGVAGMKSMEMDSCWKLYWVPFKKAAKRLRKGRRSKTGQSTPAE
ncbi:Fatty acid hydroxylase superfamily protein [Tritonibacter multivorans]|uniref:Fatty acid hydroxylase superfamily protein n=1 Tax=Tritonibacter multivorans TaxID=928856 RepID=A0A0P1GIF3_9RHOB|nr:sterol desaturase family protein [Tritonibacter multivorans]MDA7419688.1 sterol desaturase family protein [Tritonibacter multivorans]CUH75981.1 Fatty acid hydroxylase superfamily protein [Tritonibacter multivorans]SFC57607.1 Sterol desaturase/sphingolipid hydroxylase, fatty acid hydroxylase superfamily [Tritonibacter multivorans]